MTERHRSRVGPKGQVVILKELRDRFGIRRGRLVEQVPTSKGLLLVPVPTEQLMKELDSTAHLIGSAWPKGRSAAEAIREDREKRWPKK
jgi:bifunctional DNA-binding transcriptional regulator/antitoxin component of YhaV-PrlF toxin-antitoxin module